MNRNTKKQSFHQNLKSQDEIIDKQANLTQNTLQNPFDKNSNRIFRNNDQEDENKFLRKNMTTEKE